MVGSIDYYSEPFGAFNVATALRQPGSSGKPLLYALALEKNYTAASIIEDTPVAFGVSAAEVYRPVNYDSRFHGSVPLRYALANSYNIPAVKTLNSLGIDEYVSYARKLGISTWTDPSRYGLSLALGGGEVTMVDMSTAFGVLANGGNKAETTGVTKIEDSRGRQIYELNPRKNKVIDEGIAYIISDILADNVARQGAFGNRSALEVPNYKVAVKTGTTNDKKDNWTIGYAPIWNRVMTELLKRDPNGAKWPEKPVDVVEKNCYGNRKEYFLQGKEAPCYTPPLRISPFPTRLPRR
jgi:membrane peptidoglycan carboxypeptidase